MSRLRFILAVTAALPLLAAAPRSRAATDPALAFPVFEQAEKCPPAAASILRFAIGIAKQGDTAKAEEAFTQVFEQCPESATALANRGAIRLLEGHPDEALRDIERAMELTRHGKALHGILARAYVARGGNRTQHGDLRGALSDFGKASHLDPHNARIYEGVARIEWQYKEFEQCVQFADRALKEAPDRIAVRRLRAGCLLANGDLEAAEKAWSDLLAVSPRDGKGWIHLARIEAELKKCAAAADDLHNARQLKVPLDPDDHQKLVDDCPTQFAHPTATPSPGE
jgi:tetratricopeptide (TPR) repeat protein